mmetsp:Transcript_21429/g.44688  ORF Transcript_21429/g.44688 Transcript_21429/m.44688 type:complete len:144 (-) Transcript_21429:541-972(-)
MDATPPAIGAATASTKQVTIEPPSPFALVSWFWKIALAYRWVAVILVVLYIWIIWKVARRTIHEKRGARQQKPAEPSDMVEEVIQWRQQVNQSRKQLTQDLASLKEMQQQVRRQLSSLQQKMSAQEQRPQNIAKMSQKTLKKM